MVIVRIKASKDTNDDDYKRLSTNREGYLSLASLRAAFGRQDVSGLEYVSKTDPQQPIFVYMDDNGMIGGNGTWIDDCAYFVVYSQICNTSEPSIQRSFKPLTKDDVKLSLSTERAYEGLPELHSKRTLKLKEIFEMIGTAKSRHLLICAPPQSGKTSLAQLSIQHAIEKTGMRVFAHSFAGIPESGRNYEGINARFKAQFGADLNRFQTDVVDQNDFVVILDEAQLVYDATQFWYMFKKPQLGVGKCHLLTFASYSHVDNDSNALNKTSSAQPCFGTMPTMFLENDESRVSYEFVSFNKAEFDELVSQFATSGRFDPQDSNFIEFMKQNVTSNRTIKSDAEYYNDDVNDGLCYHPGLTYAILETFNSDLWTKEKVDEAIERGDNIFDLLDEMSCIDNLSRTTITRMTSEARSLKIGKNNSSRKA